MAEPDRLVPYGQGPRRGTGQPQGGVPAAPQPSNLADILERVLDKGIVIAGDISISLLDIELLTIRVRLLIASVDRAKEMGIDWWESDPMLSSSSRTRELEEENQRLQDRLARLEAALELPPAQEDQGAAGGAQGSRSGADEQSGSGGGGGSGSGSRSGRGGGSGS